MAITIHDKLYVTIQYRGDANKNEGGNLGFASPYTKDSGFKKRKETQDTWAYGHGVTVDIDDEDNLTVTGEGHRGGYGQSAQKWDASMLFIANCYPRIVPNTPVEGFEIAKSVRRHGSWGGSGNVVWRLVDPRGFELEITSENLARILDCSSLENGVIKDKCVWGREGSKNILLPVTSDIYKEAAKQTELRNKKVDLKSLNIGDKITVMTTNESSGFVSGTYLGKQHIILSKNISPLDNSGYRYHAHSAKIIGQAIPRFFVQVGDKTHVFTKLKLASIDTPHPGPLSPAHALKILNDRISTGTLDLVGSSFYQDPIMIVEKESDVSKIQASFVPCSVKVVGGFFEQAEGDVKQVSDYHRRAKLVFVSKPDGTLWITNNCRKTVIRGHRNESEFEPRLVQVTCTKEDIVQQKELRIAHKFVQNQRSGGWGYGGNTEMHIISEAFNGESVEGFALRLETPNAIVSVPYVPDPLSKSIRDVR